MKFLVTRASSYGINEDNPPCAGVTWEGESLYGKEFSIEITSLEQLIQFVNRQGKIVIYPAPSQDEILKYPNGRKHAEICIYDTYIE